MNEQIPEALKQEAERKYPNETGTFLEMPNQSKVILQRRAYIAGVLSRSGGVWQLCPKCNGQGSVNKPPYIPGDVNRWDSSATSFVCDVCNGAKIILSPAADKGDAIEFAEWKEKYLWWADMENWETKEKFDSIRWSNNSANPQYLTTKQLYKLFHQSK